MIQKWEYKVEEDVYPPQLNDFGEEGWELIAVVIVPWINTYSDETGHNTYFYFKRPKND